jgi:hypothetical protein
MYQGLDKMKQMAAPALEKRNQFVIQKGEAAFKQSAGLDKQLAELIKTDHNQIKEDVFVNVFLPFFEQMFQKEKDLPYPVTIEHWVGATGEMNKPTDVINDRGEIIKMADGTPLTIPPVFNRDGLRTMIAGRAGNNAATGQIMEEAKRYENMGESTVRGVMGKYLAAKANAAKVPGQVLATALTWNKIMAHYGRKPLYQIPGESNNSQVVQSSTQSGPSSPDGDDNMIYELP